MSENKYNLLWSYHHDSLDRRFVVYMVGNTYQATSVSHDMLACDIDAMLKRYGNWYGAQYATNKEQAIGEAIAAGYKA